MSLLPCGSSFCFPALELLYGVRYRTKPPTRPASPPSKRSLLADAVNAKKQEMDLYGVVAGRNKQCDTETTETFLLYS